ncbi:diphosphomevalonate decarboxylase [Spirochaeta cellobiosiphila]|uniref:diphosphomevalonate decarboxylase n=1 Tax=Spirochaeta cellobiosiphila TaxID=504483 RepID=UPI00041C49C0|nr:diphosphomevalonate decarboxylase [Spirochaeta cellobiosiphila]
MTTAIAHPSLALIKYWGKKDPILNLPDTTSLALTLDGIDTTTTVETARVDKIVINDEEQDPAYYKPYLDQFRQLGDYQNGFNIKSTNNFPTAAGLASSSSGFAALTVALDNLLGLNLPREELSSLARIGSGSACRALFEGFTIWSEGSTHAECIYNKQHWPELRVLLIQTQKGKKSISSRSGMTLSKETSPFYNEWLESSRSIIKPSVEGIAKRDLAILGPYIRQSYLRMFSTMFTANPPFIFWSPQTLDIIHFVQKLRDEGICVWETMDAGPQVKLFFEEKDEDRILGAINNKYPELNTFKTKPGLGAHLI